MTISYCAITDDDVYNAILFIVAKDNDDHNRADNDALMSADCSDNGSIGKEFTIIIIKNICKISNRKENGKKPELLFQ